jgi:hypothetical protein
MYSFESTKESANDNKKLLINDRNRLGQTDRETERQTGREGGREADRQTHRQTHKQTDTQTDRVITDLNKCHSYWKDIVLSLHSSTYHLIHYQLF